MSKEILHIDLNITEYENIKAGKVSVIIKKETPLWRKKLTQCYNKEEYCSNWPYPACKQCRISPTGCGAVMKKFDEVVLSNRTKKESIRFRLLSIDMDVVNMNEGTFRVKLGESI